MTIRVAINGLGRIGRNVLRAHYEQGKKHGIEVVAINTLQETDVVAHMLKYDTTHGRFNADVQVDGDYLIINGDRILNIQERALENLPWKDLNIDVVLECTGQFNSKAKSIGHIHSGAKKVLLSAPGGNDVDATIVYGVNHHVLRPEHLVISNASCTTNCLAPLVKPLEEAIGIEQGLMTTVHAYTNDQIVSDSFHKDMRRARAAAQNMIPTKTGAAKAIGLVLPALDGRLDGFAVRVPTINVSLVDLTFVAKRDTTVEEIHHLLKEASEGELKGVLAYNDEPLVSCDFNHNSASSVFDSTLTKVKDRLVKVTSWYDNEWGFSCRMLDTCAAMMNAK